MDGKNLFVIKLKPQYDWYCLPGGKIEQHETLKDCLKREITEELGIEPEIGDLAYIHELIHPDVDIVEFFYWIRNVDDYRELQQSTGTHAFEISEMRRMDIFDDTINFAPKKLTESLRKNFWKEVGVQVISSIEM